MCRRQLYDKLHEIPSRSGSDVADWPIAADVALEPDVRFRGIADAPNE